MIDIDGSRFSGSGTIVRQAVAFAALTGTPIHIINARARRPNPGLRRQHVRAVQAICELANGRATGVEVGSQELWFYPGSGTGKTIGTWDIGSAGSTTMLALAVLPILGFRSQTTTVEIRGGLFQDYAPSIFHLQHVLVPLLGRMGIEATIFMKRPGYVPTGEGALQLTVRPLSNPLRSIALETQGPVTRLWGIALASHLAERHVCRRMAEAARKRLARAGYEASIETIEDSTAQQPGAALALFADCGAGLRLGADRAGAPGRRSEDIGRFVAHCLLADIGSGATIDRFAADQVIPFAALAHGESRFVVPMVTDHLEANAWLARLMVGATVSIDRQRVLVSGVGLHP